MGVATGDLMHFDVARVSEYIKTLSSITGQHGQLEGYSQCIAAYCTAASSGELDEIFTCGIACLVAFIQQNWTGPSLPNVEFSVDRLECMNALTVDAEDPYSLVAYPMLLWLARDILVVNSSVFTHPSRVWWKYRCLIIHQKILDNHSQTLFDAAVDAAGQAENLLGSFDRDLQVRFHLEKGLLYHYYKKDGLAKEMFKKAQECSKFEWNLTGALGKRTKFQTFDVSQLVLHASSDPERFQNGSIKENADAKPANLDLNSEALLEKVQLTQPDDANDQALTGNLQRVIENPNNWMVHTMALLLRSRIESNRAKTVERSVLQLQALVDQFESDESPASKRIEFFFSIDLPAKWELEGELGERFMSLGVVRSALEIFERLQLWEQVISCHQMLEQPKKAEEKILELLKDKPDSPKLNCLLGDVQSDPSLYQKAWDLSNGRYSRAMRSLGADHYRAERWQQAIECYNKALAINALFDNSWFVLGCAALKIEDLEQAAVAFARVCSIDPEVLVLTQNGEAWNNLASVYIKQKKLVEAQRALKEAIRCNFEAANIWENYLFVSVDLGDFHEAIRAMERVFSIRVEKEDVKQHALDHEILDILVAAVCDGVKDVNGQPATKHAPQLNKLLDLILTKYSSSHLFTICAKFYEAQEKYRKALDFAQKAYRLVINDPYICEKELVFKQLVHVTLGLVDAYASLGPMQEAARMGDEMEPVCKDWQYQSKMAVKAAISKSKSAYEGTAEYETLVERLEQLKSNSY